MKTSVTKIMMSFALMGCLIIGASDASAQGRSRSQGGSSSSRSHSAAVSRSSSSAAPSVSHSSSSSSRSSSATPQVGRSSSSSSRSSSATPQVGRSSSSSSRSSSATPQVGRSSSSSSRSGHSATPRGSGNSGNSGSSVTRHSDSKPQFENHGTTPRVDRSTQSGSSTQRGDHDRKGRNPGGNDNHGNKGKGGRDNNGGIDNGRHGNGGNGGNRPDGNRPPSNRPSDKGGHGGNHGGNHGGKHGGNHGYNPNHRFDYSSHHYRDQFSWNHSHHNWSRPLPPPARAYRPAPLIWRRPVIPAGWHPYAGAPIIDRVLGLMFGTLYEVSLDQLYYDGYYIDGYADNIIYLRDVSMLNLYWPDVMLSYEYGKLANAQFVYHSGYYDRSRFDRVYNSLCRIYGSPVYQDGMTISWYGGNNTGWVTLTMTDSYGDYYTTMSIGY